MGDFADFKQNGVLNKYFYNGEIYSSDWIDKCIYDQKVTLPGNEYTLGHVYDSEKIGNKS